MPGGGRGLRSLRLERRLRLGNRLLRRDGRPDRRPGGRRPRVGLLLRLLMGEAVATLLRRQGRLSLCGGRLRRDGRLSLRGRGLRWDGCMALRGRRLRLLRGPGLRWHDRLGEGHWAAGAGAAGW
ncbi:hypothetical protein [Streptomyces mirabilis]|uniref:hypothetical protein n=1 Tax=Streptomyces mirabilis TaxID=68239 RepID=UPI003CCF1893